MVPFLRHWYTGEAPPFTGVAVKVTGVPPQIEVPGLAAILTEGVTVGLTVIVSALEVAVVGLAQAALLVSVQVMTSMFASPLSAYVGPVPTAVPFLRHWYAGDAPPFRAVAVKVTGVLLQIVVPGFAAMLTEGVTVGVTDIVSVFEVTVAGVAQAALLVSSQVMTSLWARPLSEYIGPVPTAVPFFRHWYAGDKPSFTDVAVKVTGVPLHIEVPGFAAILTEGVTVGVTVMVSVLDNTVSGTAQETLLVRRQVMTSLWARPLSA